MVVNGFHVQWAVGIHSIIIFHIYKKQICDIIQISRAFCFLLQFLWTHEQPFLYRWALAPPPPGLNMQQFMPRFREKSQMWISNESWILELSQKIKNSVKDITKFTIQFSSAGGCATQGMCPCKTKVDKNNLADHLNHIFYFRMLCRQCS